MERLSPRQQSILNRVVDTHIETAQPVGSRSITALFTELYRDSYSSATVRHEMGALEEMGYLTHPHTSAGRIPTDLGYRYYVDHSLQKVTLSADLFRRAFQELQNSSDETESLAEKLSFVISTLSKEATLVLFPSKTSRRDRFKVFLQGASNILEKPEFQDLQKVRGLFKVFEEKMELAEWVADRTPKEGVFITIGRENAKDALRDCTVISTHYSMRGERTGNIAVIGPRRMKYSHIVSLLESMAKIAAQVWGEKDSEGIL